MAKEFDNFVLLPCGEQVASKRNRENSQALKRRYFEQERCMINRAIFEENWKVIRAHATGRWSLMADYDLTKVDKADVKLDKFVTMLRVKYGYTYEKAREEVGRFCADYVAKNRIAK
jgi:hypothetical protein